MRIAIFGATSEIAKDLIASFSGGQEHDLDLYARNTMAVQQWLATLGRKHRCTVREFPAFNDTQHFDAIVNFVGVGNPAKAAQMGASIFDVTLQYDEMALTYLKRHPNCRYLFISSGASYGRCFNKPVGSDTMGMYDINNLQAQDWYGIAKLHAEARHRASASLPIIDVRIFNYFSHTQDMSARFFIADILRAIRNGSVLQTTSDYIVRDYVHPSDFQRLVAVLIHGPAANAAVDCYSKAPIDKPTLLAVAQEKFGLHYQVQEPGSNVNATGAKPYYYSVNFRAENFGYIPAFTSRESIEMEMNAALSLQQ
jgi:nucleoside-diphosphate-sugar epimerase